MAMRGVARDLFDTMEAFQAKHGWGRAIAAPQIGVFKRLVCIHVDRPIAVLNPVIDQQSDDTMELWEDCMSFPDLPIRLRNPRFCRLTYEDFDGSRRTAALTDDYAELLQHEVDHLDGILATARALDAHIPSRSEHRVHPKTYGSAVNSARCECQDGTESRPYVRFPDSASSPPAASRLPREATP